MSRNKILIYGSFHRNYFGIAGFYFPARHALFGDAPFRGPEPERDVCVHFLSPGDAHLACSNAWLPSRRMLPLCDRDHYFLARATKVRVDFCWMGNVTSRAECRCIASKSAPTKSRTRGNAVPHTYVHIVPSHYSLGLLFKDVARTCLDVMLTRARGAHKASSLPIAAAFMHPRRFSRLRAELRNNDLGYSIPFTIMPQYVMWQRNNNVRFEGEYKMLLYRWK